jgi:hypothetical protein
MLPNNYFNFFNIIKKKIEIIIIVFYFVLKLVINHVF